MDTSVPPWLTWAREIQALARTGLTYSENEFDTQRYTRLEAIAAEIVAAHTALAPAEIRRVFQLEVGYATAKIDVRGAMIRGGRVLLVQERRDQCWCLPGGWADVGEPPSAMVTREIREESGFEARVRRVIGVYDANRTEPIDFFHAYKIVFLCEIVGGEARTSNETMGVDFFDFQDLPALSAHRTDRRHLDDLQAVLADPGRATVFD